MQAATQSVLDFDNDEANLQSSFELIFSPCPETRARVYTRAKSPARVKTRLCQHHYQPWNRTWQIRTVLSQLQTNDSHLLQN